MLKHFVKARIALATLKDRLGRDESGASLVEYSVLIGVITVTMVTTLGLVSVWISGRWASVEAILP